MKTYGHILFIDIETVPQAQHFADLYADAQKIFQDRFKNIILKKSETHTGTIDDAWEELYQDNATLHAEFGKIVSIGFGYISGKSASEWELRVKTTVSKDEKELLNELAKVLNLGNFSFIAGHNSDNFDFPFLCRRMAIHGIKIPTILDPTGKKPWERCWKDTMELWGYGEWNYKCSLDRLCFCLGVPSPKGDMSGADVKDMFYGAIPGPEDLPFGKFDKELDRFAMIAKYQAGDIVATANCFLRLNNEQIIPEHKVVLV